MSPEDNRDGEPSEAQEEAASELTGGGGPGAVIYGDQDQDEAEEIGREMLEAPDENT